MSHLEKIDIAKLGHMGKTAFAAQCGEILYEAAIQPDPKISQKTKNRFEKAVSMAKQWGDDTRHKIEYHRRQDNVSEIDSLMNELRPGGDDKSSAIMAVLEVAKLAFKSPNKDDEASDLAYKAYEACWHAAKHAQSTTAIPNPPGVLFLDKSKASYELLLQNAG
jgi:hypothetical protein